jgi:hypothetical protein
MQIRDHLSREIIITRARKNESFSRGKKNQVIFFFSAGPFFTYLHKPLDCLFHVKSIQNLC